MIEYKTILKIKKDAFLSIKKDSDNEVIKSKGLRIVFFLSMYIIPLSLSISTYILEVKLSKIDGFITTGIAIFTGLFFSLLLNIGSKVRFERNNQNVDQDSFRRFKNNMKQISDIILYTIILGISIFTIIFFNAIFSSKDHPIIEKLFTCISVFLLARFFVSILYMIQRFFYTTKDEIDNILS